MFKFMKSKKGFSLVELMIVVVIMAILVAVAVPIFNSVTGNSRAKTCIDNQRQIISVIGNDLMLAGETTGDAGFVVKYDGKNATYQIKGSMYSDAELKTLFKTPPYCPEKGSEITVTIDAGVAGGTSTVSTKCNKGDATNPHVLVTGGSATGSGS